MADTLASNPSGDIMPQRTGRRNRKGGSKADGDGDGDAGATQSGPSTDKAPTVYITTATLASTSSRVAVSPIADGKSASGVTVVLDEAKTPVVVTVEPPKPPNRQTVPKTGAPAVEIVPKPATVKLAPAGLAPKPAPAPGAARSSAARVVTQPTSSPVKTSAVVMPTASSQSSKEAHGGPTPETAPSRVVSAPPPPRPTLAPGRHIVPSAVTTATGGRAHSRYSQDVDVAYTLLDWASSDEAAALYEEVKHNAVGVELIEYRVVRQGRGCVHIEGVSGGVVRTAAALVALHLKNQLELAESLERAKRAEEDLEAAEEEFSLGLRCEFPIDPEVMGLAIGKNGANIQRALETGVARVVVDKRDKVVRIRGSDPDAVYRAREIMEFQIARIPVKGSEVATIVGTGGENIHDIQAASGVLNMTLEQPGGRGTDATIVVTGQRVAVDAAKMLVETQLRYARDLQDARAKELQAVKRLTKLDIDYGDQSYVPKAEPAPEPAKDVAVARAPQTGGFPRGRGGRGSRGGR